MILVVYEQKRRFKLVRSNYGSRFVYVADIMLGNAFVVQGKILQVLIDQIHVFICILIIAVSNIQAISIQLRIKIINGGYTVRLGSLINKPYLCLSILTPRSTHQHSVIPFALKQMDDVLIRRCLEHMFLVLQIAVDIVEIIIMAYTAPGSSLNEGFRFRHGLVCCCLANRENKWGLPAAAELSFELNQFCHYVHLDSDWGMVCNGQRTSEAGLPVMGKPLLWLPEPEQPPPQGQLLPVQAQERLPVAAVQH